MSQTIILEIFTGNTWLTEIAWLVANDADTRGAAASLVTRRVSLIELPSGVPLTQPRVMNTHLHHKFLKGPLNKSRPKVVMIFRNPRDVVVSFFHYINSQPRREDCYPELKEFIEKWLSGEILVGSWFDHTKGWMEYAQENPETTLILTYEGMKADHSGTIDKLAKFFGKPLSEDQIETIRSFTSFDAMKVRSEIQISKGVNQEHPEGKGKEDINGTDVKMGQLFRKGIVGDWKNVLTPALSEQINRIWKEQLEHAVLSKLCTI